MSKQIYMVGESYLAYKEKIMQSVDIKNSQNVYDFIKSMWHSDIQIIERFLLLTISRKNSIISYQWISQGGLSGTAIDLRIIFKTAIEALSSAIIVCHNHPSGNLNPSDADITITDKISSAGNILDVKLLDHLIITSNAYYSMADNNLLRK